MRAQHQRDLEAGAGHVALPRAIGRKSPGASREWKWQWVFPATRIHIHPSGERRRHHYHQSAVQKHVRQAGREVQIAKRVSCHVLRHSFATRLLEKGYDVRTVQTVMGHKDLKTTMQYMHVLDRGPGNISSPADDD